MINHDKLKVIEIAYLKYLPDYWSGESFKWKAIQHFQKHWDIEAEDFAHFMDKQMLRNANLYQIFAYVKNADKTNSGNVSGLLLYAKTREETEPFLSAVMGGNKIDVRSLDLNRPFSAIAAVLDAIAYACFGRTVRRIA